MDTKLVVSVKQVEATINAFESNSGNVLEITNRMITLIQSLQNVIRGGGYETFKNKAAQLQGDMNQVKKMIDGHVNELREIAGLYRNLDTDNMNIANSLPTDVIS